MATCDESLSSEPAERRVDVPGALRLVLAEDDEDFRNLLAGALRRDGYHVTTVATGRALLGELVDGDARALPAIVISDERMPDLNGLGAFRAIRAAGLRMPLVLITAFGSEELVDEAAQTGATVMRKPFDVADLRTLVRCLLVGDEREPVMRCTTCGVLGDVSWLDEKTGVVLCRDCHDLSEQVVIRGH